METRGTLWTAIGIGWMGGVLSGAIGALLLSVISWTGLRWGLFSGPILVGHSLAAVCVGFALRKMVGQGWWLAGVMVGVGTVLTTMFFPIDAHSLPNWHWGVVAVLPAGLAGMILREAVGSEQGMSGKD